MELLGHQYLLQAQQPVLWSVFVEVSCLYVEVLVDVSPAVRPCPRCGQSMVIRQKKDGAGSVARIFCH